MLPLQKTNLSSKIHLKAYKYPIINLSTQKMKTNTTYYAPPILTEMELAAENGFAASDVTNANAKTISDWENGNDDWFQVN